jgi:hypothetical protein
LQQWRIFACQSCKEKVVSKQANVVLWEERIASWRSSGLSRRAWCLRHGVSVQTFGYWCRRLSSREAMLPVVVPSEDETAVVEVSLGNGVRLRLPSTMSGEALSRWLQALRAC